MKFDHLQCTCTTPIFTADFNVDCTASAVDGSVCDKLYRRMHSGLPQYIYGVKTAVTVVLIWVTSLNNNR